MGRQQEQRKRHEKAATVEFAGDIDGERRAIKGASVESESRGGEGRATDCVCRSVLKESGPSERPRR